ncbi:MAG: branched-chain amino acid ABC transporter permease, partial [Cyanobacteria bacterium J06648_11]
LAAIVLPGIANYLIFTLTLIGIYSILSLGLNIQWGFAGILNIGVGAFFAVGAYASALVTSPETNSHFGGLAMPFGVGVLCAIALSGTLAFVMGSIAVNLRSDYLAIATIGMAEIVRLVLKNEQWLTHGVRGIANIPRPMKNWVDGGEALLYLGLVMAAVAAVYWASERAYRSPWGRVLRAIREDEPATLAAGKSVLTFRLQAFVLGAMAMGLAGSLYAHFVTFISPEAFQNDFATFLVWIMLIVGGSGNTRGAVLGAFCIWFLWSGTEFWVGNLPEAWQTRAGAVRLLAIGVVLQIILLVRPAGILPEKPPAIPARQIRPK